MCYEASLFLEDNRPLEEGNIVFVMNGDGLKQNGHAFILAKINNGNYSFQCVEFDYKDEIPISVNDESFFRLYQKENKKDRDYLFQLTKDERDISDEQLQDMLANYKRSSLYKNETYEQFLLRFAMKLTFDVSYLDDFGKWIYC